MKVILASLTILLLQSHCSSAFYMNFADLTVAPSTTDVPIDDGLSDVSGYFYNRLGNQDDPRSLPSHQETANPDIASTANGGNANITAAAKTESVHHATTPLATNVTLSPSSTAPSTPSIPPTTIATDFPNTTALSEEERNKMIKDNIVRCRTLPTDRLRVACRTIVENSLQNTNYLFVVAGDKDLLNLKKELVGRGVIKPPKLDKEGRGFSVITLLPGDQSDCSNLHCPSTDVWKKGTLPEERSTSPWKFCNNYDPDRIPALISVAKCQCKGCKDPSIAGETANLVSQPVRRHLRVIKKKHWVKSFQDCSNTKECFESLEDISVGCHCMLPAASISKA